MTATIIPFPHQARKAPPWEQVLWLTIRRQRAEMRAGQPYRRHAVVSEEIERELECRDYDDLAAEIKEACDRQ